MEYKPLLLQLTHSNLRSDSQTGTNNCFHFEFPSPTSISAVPNDVVFFGKLISRERGGNYKNLKRESSSSGFDRSDRWRKIIDSGRRKHSNGLFGIVKFPLQMELSDMKMRQERRMTLRMPLPNPATAGEAGSIRGGKSCWEIVRPLRLKIRLFKDLAKARFGGCILVV